MPTGTVVSFNIADLPWPFDDEALRKIPNRVDTIRTLLAAYDYCLVQEDWMQRIDGLSCGSWYWFPSGLTLATPVAHPPQYELCRRHRRSGMASGDWFAQKGWQKAVSWNVTFAHTHLDAGNADWVYRQEQAQDLRDALPTTGNLVVSGDFNTEDATELAWLDAKLGEIGLARIPIVTNKAKDHIYTRDVVALAYGEDVALSALSDHPAVWAEIQWA